MTSTILVGDDVQTYRPRSYQLEMFEASLKENIIVAMDTGSGKTHIALLRIIHELENGDQNKLIWFLVPTVALCFQQHEAISKHVPAAISRTLTGLDKVDLWTEQPIWDAVLKDMQVVVSTHAILADAMTHGFVKISQLGLIIFDEAHHCMRKHPANKIMRDFYHPTLAKHGPEAVPRILGLTASPLVRSNLQELEIIEANLDSICRTPRIHRHQLMKHVYRPKLQRIMYSPVPFEELGRGSVTLTALQNAWNTRDIESDPYVKRLRKNSLDGKKLQATLMTGDTYCTEQLRRFMQRAYHVFEELGVWAVDYFIWASTQKLKARIDDGSLMPGCEIEEKVYLADYLSQLPSPTVTLESTDAADFSISAKLAALISFLESVDDGEFSGLIFAQQRVTVAIMAKLFSIHPATKDRFRTSSFVGCSGNNNRKDGLGELLTARMQRDTLSDFRGGRKNLLIATDVLEEGIDVSACSVVVCYDKPPNLKSFVQRRGRARRQQSTYAILVSTVDEDFSGLHKWESLEKAMIEAYRNDERRLNALCNLETVDEDVSGRFVVKSTGAVLTSDNATQHLYHFCSVLPASPYVDNKPEFSFEPNESGALKGIVILPICVNPAVRRTEGKRWWLTERAARKEAAFECYKSLYQLGLVNDNLLPLTKKPELGAKEYIGMPSEMEVSEQYDPWMDWAHSWSSPDVHQSRIVVNHAGNGDRAFMKLISPMIPPILEPLTLFWDSESTYTIEFEAAERAPQLTAEGLENMRIITALYLQATTTGQLSPERDFITLFGPDLSYSELACWLNENDGYESALEVYSRQQSPQLMGIVRDRAQYNELLIFKRWVVSDPSDLLSGLELECDPFPKRRNLLQRQTLSTKRSGPANDETPESPTKKRIVPADQCTIDKLPATETIFGRFIAAIVDRLEAALVATKLCETVLRNVGFTTLRHVITAITAPSSQALAHYQRYEFFGDSVLKFVTSCSLFYQNPNWHEGYLSEGRNAIVQNPRLTRAALDCGLDAFVMTKVFTPRKWNAPRISERINSEPTKRTMSSKMLADVVEALIGAAYVEGGLEQAQRCIACFLPELRTFKQPIATPLQDQDQSSQSRHPIQQASLETFLNYSFKNSNILIEALTHPSCQFDTTTQSYQRLEFLGDAVLDMVIVAVILQHPVEIPQGQMTLIKHAVVNANLLAFFCMESTWTKPRTHVAETLDGDFAVIPREEPLSLWQFMRCDSQEVKEARARAVRRHCQLRDGIRHLLATDQSYPWEALSKLNPDKFFSDIIESILGALFVDSGGDLGVCEMFLERIGLLTYLRRLLVDEVNVTHPKNMAQKMSKMGIIFDVKRIESEDDDGKLTATYQSTVRFGGGGNGAAEGAGADIPDVLEEGCLSSEEAEIRAANRAIEILRQKAMMDFDFDD